MKTRIQLIVVLQMFAQLQSLGAVCTLKAGLVREVLNTVQRIMF